jgi:hypothetical protein
VKNEVREEVWVFEVLTPDALDAEVELLEELERLLTVPRPLFCAADALDAEVVGMKIFGELSIP